MNIRALYFIAPGEIEVREEVRPDPAPDQCLVQTDVSAISAGTEMLLYRGQFPKDMALDSSIAALSGGMTYPVQYGYACAGTVIDIGSEVDPVWRDRRVFSFIPHQDRFAASPDTLLPTPDGLSSETVALFPNMETAVNFLHDGAPLIGERVVVMGLGIVGLLTTSLLSRMSLSALIGVDSYENRRRHALDSGADDCFDPGADDYFAALTQALHGESISGADLVYELSGNPRALDTAISVTGFAGRIVIGSWYGQKQATLDLGGAFHRSRIRLISSQVSTIAPMLQGRWDKGRRYALAWAMLSKVKPERFITHRIPIERASEAYTLLDTEPESCLQIVFTY